jgi:hypothetical protein
MVAGAVQRVGGGTPVFWVLVSELVGPPWRSTARSLDTAGCLAVRSA